MIVINKQSKTFKFYNFLSQLFFFSMVTPINQNWEGKSTAIFRDICTFARTNLFYLFISLPLMLSFIGTIFFTFYSIISAAVTLNSNPTFEIVVSLLGFFLFLSLIVGLIFLTMFIIDKSSKKLEDNTFLSLVKTSVKNKHNKFCQTLKVVDEPIIKTNPKKEDLK